MYPWFRLANGMRARAPCIVNDTQEYNVCLAACVPARHCKRVCLLCVCLSADTCVYACIYADACASVECMYTIIETRKLHTTIFVRTCMNMPNAFVHVREYAHVPYMNSRALRLHVCVLCAIVRTYT